MRLSLLHLAAALSVVGPAFAQTPADLIVKLRDPQAVATTEARDASAARLSEQAGLTLQAVGVTSGGELLLAIDREALTEKLMRAAQAMPGVAAVEPAEGDAVTIEPDAAAGAPDLATIGANLADATDAPLSTRMQGGSVVVETIPEALIDQAARRLQGAPEVAFAQPNFNVGIQPVDPPVLKPL